MILRVDGVVRTGRAVDARGLPVTGRAVATAVRGEPAGSDGSVSVEAPTPGPAHERFGHVHPALSLSARPALAAAARTRGTTPPQAEDLERLRAELATLSVPTPTRPSAEAPTTTETTRLRERVAELRGRIAERREQGLETAPLQAELTATARELSEAETERAAAAQRREATRSALRAARDARERRLCLQDRLANREREARAHLAAAVRPAFERAVAAVPGPTLAAPFEEGPVTAALACCRVAALSAPVVCAADRFRTPGAAADWLGTPVVLVDPASP